MLSLVLNTTVTVSPAFARVVSAVLSDEMLTVKISGTVKSIVTTLLSVTLLTSSPSLLARSSKTIDTDAAPSETSASTTTYVALQLDPLPLTVADSPAISTTGSMIGSSASIVTVIVSPAFAIDASAPLSEAMLTVVRVGTVKSIVTADESVTACRASP